ncbi:hypothetical protein PAPYR_10447 [Paratrimastix pyriformis]|uniref:Uncharacterized protein n=1 Tax=Paratrimastix pyriformis TaxID=342808 RepID=A0ABQ8U5G8_9EUKA|nr:hypothetical protein PAPYR_13207 [Paratrimastix pyriformis]KAJ4453138.1 hypothetical protein PAPYR_12488 [Paratrimastix pyriformis]KAJ4453276.1 hypothetical protein PAPYR_12284 [Paratrimastix pyriformis]KAJ4454759.1 hypothetical protein PAPYR_10447 [Paratrimastix pyriformis]
MLLIINPYFKLNYHFNCAPWIDGFPHSDTVYLHIQLLLYSSSETCHYHSTIHNAFHIVLTVLLELVYHLLKVIAYILNW